MAIYHLCVSVGSRSGGQSAAAKADYIEREGKYKEGAEEVAHTEHGYMPEFAAADPRQYWEAADLYERANGRLYRQVEFALPVELELREQIALAHDFAERLTAAGKWPYTLAIHKGEYDHRGKKTDTARNPHVHLIISERGNDGINRSPEQWFKRANKSQPEKGGAAKTKSMESREWLLATRELWAEMANAALERNGHESRIDHRTLIAQGITDRLPQTHRGVAGHMAQRGIPTERMAAHEQRQQASAEVGRMVRERRDIERQIREEQSRMARPSMAEPQRAATQTPPPADARQERPEVRMLLDQFDYEQLRMHTEGAVTRFEELESHTRTLSLTHGRKTGESAGLVAKMKETRQELGQLRSGFMAKLRRGGKIAEKEAELERLEAQRKRIDAELAGLPEKMREAGQARQEAGILLEALSRALDVAGAKERREQLAKYGEQAQQAWELVEKRVRETQPRATDALRRDRSLRIAFDRTLKELEQPQRSQAQTREKTRGRGFSR